MKAPNPQQCDPGQDYLNMSDQYKVTYQRKVSNLPVKAKSQ